MLPSPATFVLPQNYTYQAFQYYFKEFVPLLRKMRVMDSRKRGGVPEAQAGWGSGELQGNQPDLI
jgi:hypothetical protein